MQIEKLGGNKGQLFGSWLTTVTNVTRTDALSVVGYLRLI